MAVYTRASYASIADDATFRAWGSWISQCLAAAGWVQTADTGQIDWLTVTRPVAANTPAGYEIWTMGDALQATAPVFLKLEYGSNSAVSGRSLWYTLGPSSDGVGSLTGICSTRRQVGGPAGAGVFADRLSAAPNRFQYFECIGNSSLNYCLSIERSHGADGSDTADGVMVLSPGVASGASNWRQFYYSPGVAEYTVEASIGCLTPQITGASFSTGGRIGLSPIFLQKAGVFVNPLMDLLVCDRTTIADWAAISFTYYNQTRAYLALPAFGSSLTPRNTSWAGGFLVRNE